MSPNLISRCSSRSIDWIQLHRFTWREFACECASPLWQLLPIMGASFFSTAMVLLLFCVFSWLSLHPPATKRNHPPPTALVQAPPKKQNTHDGHKLFEKFRIAFHPLLMSSEFHRFQQESQDEHSQGHCEHQGQLLLSQRKTLRPPKLRILGCEAGHSRILNGSELHGIGEFGLDVGGHEVVLDRDTGLAWKRLETFCEQMSGWVCGWA